MMKLSHTRGLILDIMMLDGISAALLKGRISTVSEPLDLLDLGRTYM